MKSESASRKERREIRSRFVLASVDSSSPGNETLGSRFIGSFELLTRSERKRWGLVPRRGKAKSRRRTHLTHPSSTVSDGEPRNTHHLRDHRRLIPINDLGSHLLEGLHDLLETSLDRRERRYRTVLGRQRNEGSISDGRRT